MENKCYNLGSDLVKYVKERCKPEGRKRTQEEDRKYLKLDYSEPTLLRIATAKFGSKPYSNEWAVYSFLKDYCGINSSWFEPAEYEKRMAVIIRVAGV